MDNEKMRLNHYIAESGLCSRREADRLIERGEVTVNGVPAALGLTVGAGDEVCVSGEVIRRGGGSVTLLVYKPKGITSTADKADPDNIIDYVNYPKRLFTVGRLDKDSEGLILLTNNGDYVNALLRPENNHEKVYRVKVDKPLTDDFIKAMSRGVKIFNPVTGKNVITKRCQITKTSKNSFEITLTQGYNRQIRRMCEALGCRVTSLLRTKFLFLEINGLKCGKWRRLTSTETARLDKLCAPYLDKQKQDKQNKQEETEE